MQSALTFMFFIMAQGSPSVSTNVVVDKQVIYEKETSIDFDGSEVEGENQLPPAFFVMKMKTPKGTSLLAERLRFGLKDYNELGF